ncbi:hypothetical protein RB195_013395 [Necator americanus]|uniref:Uncharacterized protein n=1 Tax=Necator americanus TaxID=51031 RepID=A0ABR1DWU2_NECAM
MVIAAQAYSVRNLTPPLGRTSFLYRHFQADCNALRTYCCCPGLPPLDSSTRTRLSDAVHGKAQGGELEYNCHLEYLGWLALNDPSDSELGWLPYEDTYLLNFSKKGDEGNKPTEEFVTELGKDTKVTGKSWKLFGCNYMYKEGEHKYMCVFYNY